MTSLRLGLSAVTGDAAGTENEPGTAAAALGVGAVDNSCVFGAMGGAVTVDGFLTDICFLRASSSAAAALSLGARRSASSRSDCRDKVSQCLSIECVAQCKSPEPHLRTLELTTLAFGYSPPKPSLGV